MTWNPISAFVLDQILGYQTANKIRENLIALASARLTYHLGGSRTVSLPLVASVQDVPDYVDIEIDGTNGGGFTKQARVEVRTQDAATGIIPKVRNMTDGTDAGVGVSSTGILADYTGTNQKQTITLTIASGIKKYRLMGTPTNATNPTYCIGYIEQFASA